MTVLIAAFAISIATCGLQAQTTKAKAAVASQPAGKAEEPGDEYPRPPKPAKQYTIGVLLPHLSSAHFVGQAYGYIDEAQKLGVKVILFEAGGYEHLDRQIAQIEDLIAQKTRL